MKTCKKCGGRLTGKCSQCNPCRRAYYNEHCRTGVPAGSQAMRDKGAAAEHFVIHWLLARDFEVGGPYNMNGKHDLFVKIGSWLTVQVKVGIINRKTGSLYRSGIHAGSITSDLIAVVDLPGMRVRWESNTEAPLPPELT